MRPLGPNNTIVSPLTPEKLAITPASRPPPGVTPNLVSLYNEGKPVVIAVGTTFIVIMFAFVAMRYYMKICIHKKVAPDDGTSTRSVTPKPVH